MSAGTEFAPRIAGPGWGRAVARVVFVGGVVLTLFLLGEALSTGSVLPYFVSVLVVAGSALLREMVRGKRVARTAGLRFSIPEAVVPVAVCQPARTGVEIARNVRSAVSNLPVVGGWLNPMSRRIAAALLLGFVVASIEGVVRSAFVPSSLTDAVSLVLVLFPLYLLQSIRELGVVRATPAWVVRFKADLNLTRDAGTGGRRYAAAAGFALARAVASAGVRALVVGLAPLLFNGWSIATISVGAVLVVGGWEVFAHIGQIATAKTRPAVPVAVKPEIGVLE